MLDSPRFRAPVAVSLGAIAGALCRYYLGGWVMGLTEASRFPFDTLSVNLMGCFLIGATTVLIAQKFASKPDIALLVQTGFLGSYTTFSTYTLDTVALLDQHSLQAGAAYWVGSPLLGLILLNLGAASATVIVQYWLSQDYPPDSH